MLPCANIAGRAFIRSAIPLQLVFQECNYVVLGHSLGRKGDAIQESKEMFHPAFVLARRFGVNVLLENSPPEPGDAPVDVRNRRPTALN